MIIRQIAQLYDGFMSLFYPYVYTKMQTEYSPRHILFTGGLLRQHRKNQQQFMKNLAQAIVVGYLHGVDLYTLYLPYDLWSYEEISSLNYFLYEKFKQVNIRPFVQILTKNSDESDFLQKVEEENQDEQINFSDFIQNISVSVLSPSTIKQNLENSDVVIQLLDKRHLDKFYELFEQEYDKYLEQSSKDKVKKEEKDVLLQNPNQFTFTLPGLQPDSSKQFNRMPDLMINFGGDMNPTMQCIPFWLIRKCYIRFIGSLGKFKVWSMIKCISWYDRCKSKQALICKLE